MAYVNVVEWKPEQVAQWLKGLDSDVLPYIKNFIDNNIDGPKLLALESYDFERIGVHKVGHQELIMEPLEQLKHFHYELDKENVQTLALQLSCRAHSLYRDIKQNYLDFPQVPFEILSDIVYVISALKPLIDWLDRPPFNKSHQHIIKKKNMLELALKIVICGQRDQFVLNPLENIFNNVKKLANLADQIIQESTDSLILQPATLDVATLKKRPGEFLGFYIQPSFHGIHQIGEVKCNSAAHQCKKIEAGDEIVQVNYQTVVGWKLSNIMDLFDEASTDIFLTLKKQPRHSKVYGQIYMAPYPLPTKSLYNYHPQRYLDQLTPPRRSDLWTLPNFSFPVKKKEEEKKEKVSKVQKNPLLSDDLFNPTPAINMSELSISPEICSRSNSSSNDSELEGAKCSSPTSVRLFLPKPHIPVQRRATISGASPIETHAPFNYDQFLNKFKKENEAHNNNKNNSEKSYSETQLNKHSKPTQFHRTSLPLNEEMLKILRYPEKKLEDMTVKDDVLNSRNFISVKERIRQLNMNNSPEHNTNKKSEALPKPIVSKISMSIDNPITKLRGKLGKSYSISYDLNADVNTNKGLKSFDSDLKMSVEDKNIFDMKEVTNMCAVNENQIKKPNKPIHKFFSKSHLSKKYDDTSCANLIELKSVNSSDQSVKSSSYFPKHLSPKAEGKYDLKTKDTDIDTGIKHQFNKSCKKSSSIVLESASSFSFDPKHEEHFLSSAKSYSDNNNGCFFKYDGATAHCSQDSRVPMATDSFKYSMTNVKNKSYSMHKFQRSINVEKNSFSNLSDVCSSPLILTEPSDSDDDVFQVDTKDNISLSSEKSAVVSRHDLLNASVTFHPKKTEAKNSQPPILAPRQSKLTELPKRSNYQNMLDAKAIGKEDTKGQAQLFQRNPLIAKRRKISTKELCTSKYQGWLYHRSKKISPQMQWIKGWFIIRGNTFYGFNNKESKKARLMIVLSGFMVSIAHEVKSRNNVFKVYNTGTVFYFATDTPEDLSMWLKWFSTATIADEHNSNIAAVSETEDEDENDKKEEKDEEDENFNEPRELAESLTSKPEATQESISSTSAFKNMSAFFSRRIGFHSNPKKNKTDKSTSSLKKQQKKEAKEKEDQGSLDRRSWTFLGIGIGRDSNEPVPTSQFRSYRRIHPTVPKRNSDSSGPSNTSNQK